MSRIARLLLGTTFFLIIILGCKDELPINNEFASLIVVDGRIETNAYARVFVTQNMPYYSTIDSSNVYDYIIRHARVEISDGERKEVLTLKYNKNLFPPYYYQGTEILGEVGKTYSLRVLVNNKTIVAYTTIPNPPEIEDIWFSLVDEISGKGNIMARVKRSPSGVSYYRFYYRILNKQNKFYPTLIPNFDGQLFPTEVFTISLSRGPETYLDISYEDYFFNQSDTIVLKACTIDSEQFKFWSYYHSEVVAGSNPLASSFAQPISNITGGLGNWGGFAVSYFLLSPEIE